MSISLSSLILCPIWISMAQIQQGGPDEKEKTTALKDLLSRIDLDELMKKDEPPLDFPDTLEGFEYAFNEKGQLRHIKTGEPFVFNYREDLHRWNQKRYEALGEIITKYVYELLEKDCNLKKISIPEGYGVIVLNPNENYIEVEKPKIHVQSSSDSSDEPAEKRERKDKVSKETKKRRDFYEKYRNPQREKEMMQLYIRENGSPEEHAIYVWDHFIAQSAAENVFFVAHSYGGLAFVELMIQREADVKSKVTAVALTDSVHNVWHQEAGKTIREWMRENCCNWVSSSEPLDTSVESMLPDCPRVSAVLRPNEEECGQSRLVRNNWIEAITKSKGNRPDRRYSNVFFSLSLFFENSTLSAISTHFSLISKCYYINVVSLFLSSIIRHFFLNI
ncbi:cotranscriptional regulator FAM172A isoform X7 [Myotis myotis]|uniref:cotranscriptional regulator FAM172A isoform X7 n=1 Tax=Myotis myotis TaxID=51298 RepID=UPI0017492F06|nr:cotranscriptional regulator FAM172A isoform X7 [Myotis myotis]